VHDLLERRVPIERSVPWVCEVQGAHGKVSCGDDAAESKRKVGDKVASRKAKKDAVQLSGLASLGAAEKRLASIKKRTEKLLTGTIDVRQLGYFLEYLKRELGIEGPAQES
jgi:hypothetical protein